MSSPRSRLSANVTGRPSCRRSFTQRAGGTCGPARCRSISTYRARRLPAGRSASCGHSASTRRSGRIAAAPSTARRATSYTLREPGVRSASSRSAAFSAMACSRSPGRRSGSLAAAAVAVPTCAGRSWRQARSRRRLRRISRCGRRAGKRPSSSPKRLLRRTSPLACSSGEITRSDTGELYRIDYGGGALVFKKLAQVSQARYQQQGRSPLSRDSDQGSR